MCMFFFPWLGRRAERYCLRRLGLGWAVVLQVDNGCLVLGACVADAEVVCLRLLLGNGRVCVQAQVVWTAIWIWTGEGRGCGLCCFLGCLLLCCHR